MCSLRMTFLGVACKLIDSVASERWFSNLFYIADSASCDIHFMRHKGWQQRLYCKLCVLLENRSLVRCQRWKPSRRSNELLSLPFHIAIVPSLVSDESDITLVTCRQGQVLLQGPRLMHWWKHLTHRCAQLCTCKYRTRVDERSMFAAYL